MKKCVQKRETVESVEFVKSVGMKGGRNHVPIRAMGNPSLRKPTGLRLEGHTKSQEIKKRRTKCHQGKNRGRQSSKVMKHGKTRKQWAWEFKVQTQQDSKGEGRAPAEDRMRNLSYIGELLGIFWDLRLGMNDCNSEVGWNRWSEGVSCGWRNTQKANTTAREEKTG